MHKKNRGEINMKILRIDRQGVSNGAVYNDLESLRQDLCCYHSIDWQIGIDENDKDYIDIHSLTLDEIMDHGDWEYEKITEEEAKQYDDHR